LQSPSTKHYSEQYNPLKTHLEQGIGEVTDSADHHGEWTIVWTISWEFPIDPIADTTESKRDRDTYCEDICDLEESITVSLGKKKNGHKNSEESSMKTHASLPYREDLQGIGYKE
jgi:hypothetical protein